MLQAIISVPNELGDYENPAVCAGRPVRNCLCRPCDRWLSPCHHKIESAL